MSRKKNVKDPEMLNLVSQIVTEKRDKDAQAKLKHKRNWIIKVVLLVIILGALGLAAGWELTVLGKGFVPKPKVQVESPKSVEPDDPDHADAKQFVADVIALMTDGDNDGLDAKMADKLSKAVRNISKMSFSSIPDPEKLELKKMEILRGDGRPSYIATLAESDDDKVVLTLCFAKGGEENEFQIAKASSSLLRK